MLATAWPACQGSGGSAEPAPQPTASLTTQQGDEITLNGRITESFGAHVFAVGSGAEQVIVVTVTPVGVSVGRDVDVTGRVRTFRRVELEAELGVDLGGSATNALEERSCLVASVARLR